MHDDKQTFPEMCPEKLGIALSCNGWITTEYIKHKLLFEMRSTVILPIFHIRITTPLAPDFALRDII